MGGIIIDNKIIRNNRKIKILGTYFSADCKFNDNLLEGSNSLLTQLKRRANAIKRISKYFPLKFKIQLVNALLYGKLRYNLATWGNLSKTSMKKVNNIILQTIKIITRDNYFGKEIKWIMRKHNLMDFYELYQSTCFKQTFSNLNDIGDNVIKKYSN